VQVFERRDGETVPTLIGPAFEKRPSTKSRRER
jgi:hypothetical protein